MTALVGAHGSRSDHMRTYVNEMASTHVDPAERRQIGTCSHSSTVAAQWGLVPSGLLWASATSRRTSRRVRPDLWTPPHPTRRQLLRISRPWPLAQSLTSSEQAAQRPITGNWRRHVHTHRPAQIAGDKSAEDRRPSRTGLRDDAAPADRHVATPFSRHDRMGV